MFDFHIQKEPYSCWPCAIINWVDHITQSKYTEEELIKICNAKPLIWCENEDIIVWLNHVWMEIFDSWYNREICDLEKAIDMWHWVIVNYFNALHNVGHYSFLFHHDENSFYFKDSAIWLVRIKKDKFFALWHNSDQTKFRWFVSFKTKKNS